MPFLCWRIRFIEESTQHTSPFRLRGFPALMHSYRCSFVVHLILIPVRRNLRNNHQPYTRSLYTQIQPYRPQYFRYAVRNGRRLVFLPPNQKLRGEYGYQQMFLLIRHIRGGGFITFRTMSILKRFSFLLTRTANCVCCCSSTRRHKMPMRTFICWR